MNAHFSVPCDPLLFHHNWLTQICSHHWSVSYRLWVPVCSSFLIRFVLNYVVSAVRESFLRIVSFFSFSALKRPWVLYHPLELATVSIKAVKVPSVRRVTLTALRSPVYQVGSFSVRVWIQVWIMVVLLGRTIYDIRVHLGVANCSDWTKDTHQVSFFCFSLVSLALRNCYNRRSELRDVAILMKMAGSLSKLVIEIPRLCFGLV